MSAMTSLLRAAGLLGACFVALAATPEARSQARAQILELDRIVAIVNDDVIVESELSARVETVRAQMRDSSTQPPPEGVLRRQVLDRLIIDRLQLQLAERGGLRVDDETLNQSVAAIAAQNQLSLREFRDILERDGYDFGKFREEVRNELLISQLRLRQVDNRIRVSPQDIDNFLATLTRQGGQASSYHLGHILIAVPEAASPEQIAAVRVQAEEALARLRDGADFAQTATALSDGQQALAGGDLGWRTAAELPTIFADAIPGLAVGEMTDLIRSPSGFHIVKLLALRGEEQVMVTQTHARHILIRPDEPVSPAEARRRLEALRERLENVESFAELARAHSQDSGTASKGGDLGWVNPGALIPAFERVMNSLQLGELSEPFETQFGLHIVQVLERREHDDTEQARRGKAAEEIRARKLEEELQNWLRQIRDEAYVEYRLDEP
jgi:peptidyl-prolyl cis-trans isomerase SurA